jgi:hypothetical protein
MNGQNIFINKSIMISKDSNLDDICIRIRLKLSLSHP